MAVSHKALAKQETVRRFAEEAEIFCTLLESSQDYTPNQFVAQIAQSIAGLYRAALMLPDVEVSDEDTVDSISELIRAEIYRKIDLMLGRFNIYQEMFDPFDLSDSASPVMPSIADDLTDIYLDVKKGVDTFNSGLDEDVNRAIWQWKFTFRIHWGYHLVGALRAVHRILANNLISE